ncbi:MAG: hypothetical protein JW966_07645 [Anaerolineae bacterium]|nr:hypothetical protein [Anaerolineae bacterium]
MIAKLYLANLPPTISENQLQDLFAEVGQSERIKFIGQKEDSASKTRALIWIQTESSLTTILEQFNGHEINGYRLAVTPSKAPSELPDLTAEQHAVVQDIADQLGETERIPCRQIRDTVRLCGVAFARSVLEETIAVEEAGGMVTQDGSRRRTPGGVFFYLARGRMALSLKYRIFSSVQKKQTADAGNDKAQDKSAKDAASDTGHTPSQTGEHRAAPPDPAPVVSPEELSVAQQQLEDLREAHQNAQANLIALQNRSSGKPGGTFTAIKKVFDLQRQIEAVLKKYPQLSE